MRWLDAAPIELAEAARNALQFAVGRRSFRARGTLQQTEKTLQFEPMLRINPCTSLRIGPFRELRRAVRGPFAPGLCAAANVSGGVSGRFAHRKMRSD